MAILSPTAHRGPALPSALLAIYAGGLANLADRTQVALRPGESRRYVQIFASEEYDAWLIAWAPRASVDPHDHGGSRGVVRVISGELCEAFIDHGSTERAHGRVIAEGDTLEIPEHRIHEVWNAGPGDAISVHVYSPPLQSMEFFDRATITDRDAERHRQTA